MLFRFVVQSESGVVPTTFLSHIQPVVRGVTVPLPVTNQMANPSTSVLPLFFYLPVVLPYVLSLHFGRSVIRVMWCAFYGIVAPFSLLQYRTLYIHTAGSATKVKTKHWPPATLSRQSKQRTRIERSRRTFTKYRTLL